MSTADRSARAGELPTALRLVNPTARKQTLRVLDMRATVDREQPFGSNTATSG